MKPLIRWTVGPQSDVGFECLSISVKNWKKLYGDRFDTIICNNGSNHDLYSLGVDVLDQRGLEQCLPFPVRLNRWKLAPPRLRLESYEIFIDSDLVVYKKMPLIEDFLSNNSFFISGDRGRNLGGWDEFIPIGATPTSTAFWGIPPMYNLEKEITRVYALVDSETAKKRKDTYFYEQGMVSYILYYHSPYVIPLEDIGIHHPGKYGIHFTSLNKHRVWSWDKYKDVLDDSRSYKLL